MMRFFYLLCTVGLLLGVLAACDGGEASLDPAREGRRYYPAEVGRYNVYAVTQVQISAFTPDTTRYQLKELVESVFDSTADQVIYRIERYKRLNSTQNWLIDSVWTLRKQTARMIRVESNVPFVRLVFPLDNKLSWNGNVLNSLGEAAFTMSAVAQPYAVGGQNYNQTVTVTHQDSKNIIAKRYSFEVFARDLGLVHKRVEILNYVASSTDPFYGTDRVVSGTYLDMQFVETGKQ